MQQEIPAEKLSRVYSYDALGSLVLMPLGFAVVGPVAGVLGTSTTLWGAFVVNTALTLGGARGRRRPRPSTTSSCHGGRDDMKTTVISPP